MEMEITEISASERPLFLLEAEVTLRFVAETRKGDTCT